MAAVRIFFFLFFVYIVISNEDVEKIKWNKMSVMVVMVT
jgi:hypothetical protein